MNKIKKVSLRLLGMATTMIIGTVVIFILSRSIPHDDIDILLSNLNMSSDNKNYDDEYTKYYIAEGRHKPMFYFSILPQYYHRNIHSFTRKQDRALITSFQDQRMDCSQIENLATTDLTALKKVNYSYPTVVFHGMDNQYHNYISRVLTGDLGVSKKEGKPAIIKIKAALYWTLSIVLINLILATAIALSLSYYLVRYQKKVLGKWIDTVSLLIYSIPGFWLATMVLILFTGDQYGMPIFYSPLYVDVDPNSFFSVLTKGWSKMVPVIFCLTLIDVAYLVRMLKSNLQVELASPYVMAMRARGIEMPHIIKKHAFRNVMIPMVTLIVGSLPLAIGGSLVFEIIFNISGIGRLLYESIYTADWNVVYGIVLLILFTTIIFYHLADYLYRKLDPRILTK